VQKIVEYKRALPAPYGSQVVAKLLMAIALSIAVIVLLIGLGATLGRVPLNAGQFGAIGTIVLAGVFPVSAIGSYLATRAAPSGVSPIAGALLVGMAILGGLFYPLPGVLSTLRPLWPTYHLQQLCLAALGQATAYSPATHVVALIAITGLFGLLAASRLARAE
jgi:ABC-2 type transport system permease protein